MPTTYTVKQGDTLNAIAKSLGYSNYKEAGLSAPSGNPDLIRVGETLNVPSAKQTTPTLQQTTTSQRQEIENNKSKFDNIKNQFSNTTPTPSANEKNIEASNDLKNDIKNSGKDTTVEESDPYNLSSKIKKIKNTYKAEVDDIEDRLATLQTKMDSASSSLIEGIRQSYQGRIKKMEQSNEELYAVKENLGFRQGRARYAQGIQAGILTNEELDGQGRIAELQGEMFKLIASAEQAQAENDLSLFDKQYDKLQTTYKNMQDEISTLYKNAVDEDKAIRERAKAEREAVKAEFDLSVDKSKASAPALAEKLKEFTSPEDKQAFIDAYAKASGISDPDILFGELDAYLTQEDKDALDLLSKQTSINSSKASMSNTYSTIDERNRKKGEEEDKKKIRQELYSALSSKQVSFGEAKDVWVTAGFTIPDFTKEFSEFEEE